MKYKNFLDILVSPDTKEPLFIKDDCLKSASGKTYKIINNIPILVKLIQEMHIHPPAPEKTSQNITEYKVGSQYAKAKHILHLGSGNVGCSDKRVLSMDVLPCENVDLVAEAENLPFKSNSFDLVVSSAVFEHLTDPLAAIKEIKRILKPGGIFIIDNSYLQPYHGFPGNYFNMTPQANETYLVDDFILIQSVIPESGTPLMTLSMIIDRFLANLDSNKKKQVLSMNFEKFIDTVKSDLSSKNILLENFSEYEKRSMAATHLVIAKKPDNYEEKLRMIKCNKNIYESWMLTKQQYYILRTEIIMRHHEIYLYRRFVLDINPSYELPKILPQSLESILKKYLLTDPLNCELLTKVLQEMKLEESNLKDIRDKFIKIYLGIKYRGPAGIIKRVYKFLR